MAALDKYTTTEAIRACLAVDESDIPDSYILGSNLLEELLLHLDEWLPDHKEIIEGSDRVTRLLKMFSQWYCGYLLSERELGFIGEFSDGKTKMKRLTSQVQNISQYTQRRSEQYRKMLMQEYGIQDPYNQFSFLSSSRPSYDPVTGGEA